MTSSVASQLPAGVKREHRGWFDMGGVPFHDIAQHVVFLRIAGTAVVSQIHDCWSSSPSNVRLMSKSAKRASLIENLRSLRGLGKMRVR